MTPDPDDLADAVAVRKERASQRRTSGDTAVYLAAGAHVVCFVCAIWTILAMSFERQFASGASTAFFVGTIASIFGFASVRSIFALWFAFFAGIFLVTLHA
jgi:hypothetical protein